MIFPKHWIFLRGLSRNSKHWGTYPKAFEKALKVRVLCLDLPGFGALNHLTSPLSISGISEAVVEKIKALGLENNLGDKDQRFGILGISLGGMVAMDLAATYPDLVSHLVLINTSLGALSKPHLRMKLSALPKLISATRLSNSDREKTILGITCNDPKVRLKLHDSWCLAAEKHPFTAKNVLRQLAAAASYRRLPEIQARALILASKEDRLVSPRCSQSLADHYGWPIETHSWGGHDLVIDDPNWSLDQIKAWT